MSPRKRYRMIFWFGLCTLILLVLGVTFPPLYEAKNREGAFYIGHFPGRSDNRDNSYFIIVDGGVSISPACSSCGIGSRSGDNWWLPQGDSWSFVFANLGGSWTISGRQDGELVFTLTGPEMDLSNEFFDAATCTDGKGQPC